jgi:tRNA(Ile)-lysidine synthase
MSTSLQRAFHLTMEGFCLPETPPRLAVALSGGADSLALTLLAHDWTKAKGGSVTALTVDHRLRPESTREARQVAAWMQQCGIAHYILPWEHSGSPAGNLQATAREARYQLLGEACTAHGIRYLLTAHHLDDQRETLLARFLRGSGTHGMCGIPAERLTPWGRILRPLLDIPKAELKDFLQIRKQEWIHDSSNESDRFQRNRLRRLIPALEQEGLTLTRTRTLLRLAQQDWQEKEQTLQRAWAECITLHEAGFATLKGENWHEQPQSLRFLMLERLLTLLTGRENLARGEEIERLMMRLTGLTQENNFPGATLGGVRFAPSCKAGENHLHYVFREAKHLAPPLRIIPNHRHLWDGRFEITLTLPGKAENYVIRAMDGATLQRLRRSCIRHPLLRLPATVLATIPVLTRFCSSGIEALSAVPHINWYAEEFTAEALQLAFLPMKLLAASPDSCITV